MEVDFLPVDNVLATFLDVTLLVWFQQFDSALQELANVQKKVDKLQVCPYSCYSDIILSIVLVWSQWYSTTPA